MAKEIKKTTKKSFRLSDLWNYLIKLRKKSGKPVKAVKPGAKPYLKSPEELLEDAINKVKDFYDKGKEYRETHMNNFYIALFGLGGRLSYFKPNERVNYYKKVGPTIEEIARENDVSFFGMIEGQYRAKLELIIPEIYTIPKKPREKEKPEQRPGEKPKGKDYKK